MNNPALGDDRVRDARDRIAPLLTAVVDRAKAQALVRADVEQTDLVFMQVALSAIMDSTRGVAPDLYRRYLTLFLDGMRADRGPATPFPAAALTADQTHIAMTSRRRDPKRGPVRSGPQA